MRHTQLDFALLHLTDGYRRIRPKIQEVWEIHKCISIFRNADSFAIRSASCSWVAVATYAKNKSQLLVSIYAPTVSIRHAQLESALQLLTDGWRRIRPKRKKLPEIRKCISGSFFLFSLAWLVAYSNSWADRFIWLFLSTHLCILFFIFILFRIFVYLI